MTMTQRVSVHFFQAAQLCWHFFGNMFNLQSCEMVVCQERRRKLTSEAQKAVTAALREAAVQDGSDVEVQHGDVPCLPVAVGRICHPLKGTFPGC